MTLYDASGKPVPALAPNAAQENDGNLDVLATSAPTQQDLMAAILRELQIMNLILERGMNLPQDFAAQLRSDTNFPGE